MNKAYFKTQIIENLQNLISEIKNTRMKLETIGNEISQGKKKGNLNSKDIEEIVELLNSLFEEFKRTKKDLNKLKTKAIKYENKTLGEFLKESRKKINKSQDVVASELNICKSTISRWENSEMLPSLPMLEKIAKVYGINDYEKLRNYYLFEKKLKEK